MSVMHLRMELVPGAFDGVEDVKAPVNNIHGVSPEYEEAATDLLDMMGDSTPSPVASNSGDWGLAAAPQAQQQQQQQQQGHEPVRNSFANADPFGSEDPFGGSSDFAAPPAPAPAVVSAPVVSDMFGSADPFGDSPFGDSAPAPAPVAAAAAPSMAASMFGSVAPPPAPSSGMDLLGDDLFGMSMSAAPTPTPASAPASQPVAVSAPAPVAAAADPFGFDTFGGDAGASDPFGSSR
jgi:hypothetical protein